MKPRAQTQTQSGQHNVSLKIKHSCEDRCSNPETLQADEQEIILFPTLPSSDGRRQCLLPSQIAFLPGPTISWEQQDFCNSN